jgi:hypothetical protein
VVPCILPKFKERTTMTLEAIAARAMRFVERYWAYWDNDWGRTRCRFCGASGVPDGRENIRHSDDCDYVRLTQAYKEHVEIAQEEDF